MSSNRKLSFIFYHSLPGWRHSFYKNRILCSSSINSFLLAQRRIFSTKSSKSIQDNLEKTKIESKRINNNTISGDEEEGPRSLLSRVRGMVDLVGEECEDFSFVENQGRRVAKLYGFEEVRTPIIEFTHLFNRSLGEGSDVVSKEMYTFDDRRGQSLTLRPEMTASVVRAILCRPEAATLGSVPKGFYYHGPMFRYERPQRGRQRQFTQFGVELFGADGPSADIQVVAMAHDFLKEVGLLSRCKLLINSLGDDESRSTYSNALENHFSRFKGKLSVDSERRLSSGRILRILDSKDPKDFEAIESAPKPVLSKNAALRYEKFRQGLDILGIEYEEDVKLVRGLDYYSHTIFEFVLPAEGDSTRPSAIVAGGRYDGLALELGYTNETVPAIGWAAGIERICLEREKQRLQLRSSNDKVLIVPLLETKSVNQKLELDQEACKLISDHCLRVADGVRKLGLATQLWLQAVDTNIPINSLLKKAFKMADKSGSTYVAIVGSSEAKAGDMTANFKYLKTGQQQVCNNAASLSSFIQNIKKELH